MTLTTRYVLVFLLFLGCQIALTGCPSASKQAAIHVASTPEEKAYRLDVNQPLTVPIVDDEAVVYRFEAHIHREGLYQFETMGDVDTLCALLHKEKQKEHFLVVRDVGGTGENCRILWSFPPGIYFFKVRVDGKQHFQVSLRRISSGKIVEHRAQSETIHKDRIEDVRDSHRFHFSLRSPRLVQFHVQGNGTMQCILRRSDGQWLSPALFRQPYGKCTLGEWLPPGRYSFELRSDLPRVDYQMQFEPIRLQTLSDNQLQEGYLQPKLVDIFRFQLQDKRQHILQTFGNSALTCTLENPLGHVVAVHQNAPDQRNCLLSGQFKPGMYYLRVRLRHGTGSIYHIALRQPAYTLLSTHKTRTVVPNFQQPMQLYRIDVQESRLYQIEISGRTLRCSLHNVEQQPISLMDLSEPQRCLLFANLYQGHYFLQIYPLSREDTPYHIHIVAYQPPQGNQLKNQQPYLVGPVYPGFRRVFQLTIQQAQLLVLETRGMLDTVCELYDNNQQRLAHNDDDGKDYNCRIHRYLQPGQYQFHVRVSGRRSGIFWVQSKAKPLPWVHPGQTISFTFKYRKQRMIHLLQVRQRGLFSIRTESKLDTKCRILNQDWTLVAEDDDSGHEKNCFLAQFLAPGIYPLEIWLYRQDAGQIKLLLDRLPVQNIGLGERRTHHLGPPNWTHFYQLQVQQPGIYFLRTLGSLDTKCILRNEQSQILATNDDRGGGDKNCQVVETLKPGTYFFQVLLYKNVRIPVQQNLPYQVWFDIHRTHLVALPLHREITADMAPETIRRFHFKITQAGRYRIETKGMLDPQCRLLNNNFVELAKDDDSGIARNCRIVRYLKPGDYEIHVRPATQDRSKNTGTYSISIFQEGS